MSRMRWPNRGGGGSQNVYSHWGRYEPDSGVEYVTYDDWLTAVGTKAGEIDGLLRRGGHPTGAPVTVEAIRRAHRADLAGSDRSPGGEPLAWTEVVFRSQIDGCALIHDWRTYNAGDLTVLFRDERGSAFRFWCGDVREYVVLDRAHPRLPDAVMALRAWIVPTSPLNWPEAEMLLRWVERGWKPSWTMRRAIGEGAIQEIRLGQQVDAAYVPVLEAALTHGHAYYVHVRDTQGGRARTHAENRLRVIADRRYLLQRAATEARGQISPSFRAHEG